MLQITLKTLAYTDHIGLQHQQFRKGFDNKRVAVHLLKRGIGKEEETKLGISHREQLNDGA
jgi:hypothetical protein